MNEKLRKLFTIGLFSFVVVAVALAVVKEMKGRVATLPKVDSKSVDSDITKSESDRVVVYYFHTSFRCPSCYQIERYSDEAVHSAFKDEFEKKTIEWRVVNVEEPFNRYFIEKYKLFTKSVVVSAVKDNIKWKVLDKTWNYLGDKSKFFAYIQSEVKDFFPLIRK